MISRQESIAAILRALGDSERLMWQGFKAHLINVRKPLYFLEALQPKTSQLVCRDGSLCTELTLLGQDQGLVHSLCFLLGLTRSCIVAIWQIIGLGSPSLNFTAESHSLGSPAPWPFLSFLALAGWCMLDWILMGGNYAVIAQALFGSGLLPALKFT